jgi:hypothetical protein
MPFDREAESSFALLPIVAIVACVLVMIALTIATIRNTAAATIGISSILTPEMLRTYTPSARASAAMAAVIVICLCGGFVVSRLRSRIPAWVLGALTVGATLRLVDREPAGVRMLAIVVVLLLAMKAIVARDHGGCEETQSGPPCGGTAPSASLRLLPDVPASTRRRASHPAPSRSQAGPLWVSSQPLSFAQWLAFAFWFGMRPSIFASLGKAPREGSAKLAAGGLRGVVAGSLLLAVARLIALSCPPFLARLIATPLLLVGLSLILHFGILNLLASFWRTRGVPAERLFHDPLHATSPADFWSHRWNLGFAEMTAVAVHRPFRRLAGRKLALITSFLVSGILHELAISVPVRAGYGLPTLYFALQGLLVASGIRSRPLLFLGLIAPLPLVFHLPFLRAVIWPLAGIR